LSLNAGRIGCLNLFMRWWSIVSGSHCVSWYIFLEQSNNMDPKSIQKTVIIILDALISCSAIVRELAEPGSHILTRRLWKRNKDSHRTKRNCETRRVVLVRTEDWAFILRRIFPCKVGRARGTTRQFRPYQVRHT
jgi:hypothetical protein